MPKSTFIRNKGDNTLKNRISQLIEGSQEMKVLVGFFYFSGMKALFESLKKSPGITLKILVGLEIENVLGSLVEFTSQPEARASFSNEEISQLFFRSVKNTLSHHVFDDAAHYQQVLFFVDLIKQGKIEIRKTLEPNHAKLYIFKAKDELKNFLPPTFITGSSNLTQSGLESQNELNVEISDFGCQEAEEYFDELWDSAVKITENPAWKKRLVEIIEDESLLANVTPFEAYLLVLKTFIDLQNQKDHSKNLQTLLTDNNYTAYRYQMDAVNQALTILEEYNGVIIADVVGLGKSIIASMIARETRKRGIILCPPGLIGEAGKDGWEKYRNEFKLYDWEIESTGKLEKALERIKDDGDFEVIIIDEAHRFRNQDSQDYELLSHICRNKQVILLTATPFNNHPGDIFALLKLFTVPNKSKLTIDNDLAARFSYYESHFKKLSYIVKYNASPDPKKRERALKYYRDCIEDNNEIDLRLVRKAAKFLSCEIRQVIEPVIIRRNRLDLRKDPDYCDEVTNLSTVAPPQELFFELTARQLEYYDTVLDDYFAEDNGQFTGAIYQPFHYEKQTVEDDLDEKANREYNQQKNLSNFMRRLLVKRFESSFGAFQQSIVNFKDISVKVLAFINKTGKYILDRKLLEKIYELDAEDIEQNLIVFANEIESAQTPKNNKVYVIDKFVFKDLFLAAIESDIALFDKILADIDNLGLLRPDPKATALIHHIGQIITNHHHKEPVRKVIVFSEYSDTVTYLRPFLEKSFPGKVITGSAKSTESQIDQILADFDAGIKPQKQTNNFEILLTTDKLSEGFNLNRAGAIINYDIPWNPTRVIQRLGRINRIGKKVFEQLYIYNFFPTIKGSGIVKSREIAQEKMFLIHNTIGEDAQIFGIEETPTASSLYRRINRHVDESEEASLLTNIKLEYQRLIKAHPEIAARIASLPLRIKTAKRYTQNNLMVFRRKGLALFAAGVPDTGIAKPEVKPLLLEDVLTQIKCEANELRLPLSANFWPNYEDARDYREKFKVTKNSNALVVKAENNLRSAQTILENGINNELLPFIRTLLSDIRDYGTMPEYTLRSLAEYELKSGCSAKTLDKFIQTITYLRKLLGDDYLDVLKKRLGNIDSEVIVAVENIKIGEY